ncbi:hypothetical protein [Bacillus sp. S14(2024)]|uniref:hypothetical protein n=1 Tax=Bacillus sp. S14(2024) TaxID=3162884 RepID=UPI003D1C3E30
MIEGLFIVVIFRGMILEEETMDSVDIYNHVKQLIQKYNGIDTDIEMHNLKMNKNGFNNNIAMFHLTLLKSEES